MLHLNCLNCSSNDVPIQAEGGREEDGGEALCRAHRRARGVPAR